jgi:hypothetical protein
MRPEVLRQPIEKSHCFSRLVFVPGTLISVRAEERVGKPIPLVD